MLRPIDAFFYNQIEPAKSCLEFLRSYLLSINKDITEEWKYGAPFYFVRGKRFCYLWVNKKWKQPYIGIIDGSCIEFSGLIQENRKRMKVYPINANKAIDVKALDRLMKKVLSLYIVTN